MPLECAMLHLQECDGGNMCQCVTSLWLLIQYVFLCFGMATNMFVLSSCRSMHIYLLMYTMSTCLALSLYDTRFAVVCLCMCMSVLLTVSSAPALGFLTIV